ncbi:MAG: hypothetical protein LBU23_04190 [Planctomycetota bacterium]|jgi:hypothetical protein|nr:hypothetical protein [Planctomycetota bacterium]
MYASVTAKLAAAGWLLALALALGGVAGAEDARQILQDRDGARGGGVSLNYRQTLFEKVLADLEKLGAGLNLKLKAPSLQEERELLRTPVTFGPLSGVAWETAVNAVADHMKLVVDRSQFGAGVIYLEKMPRFTGTFDGIRFGEAVREIARIGNANVLFSAKAPIDSVVYLSFTDVPWREAITSLIGAHDCTILYDGDNQRIMRIATMSEGKLLFVTRSRPLRYIQPEGPHFRPDLVEDDIDDMIDRKGTGAADVGSLISILKTMATNANQTGDTAGEVGSINFDPRTNTMIMRDTQQNIQQMMEVIDQIDQPPQQVLVETRLLTMQENPTLKLGVKWGDGEGDSYTGLNVEGARGPSWNTNWPWSGGMNWSNPVGTGVMSMESLKFALQAARSDQSIRITQAPQILVLDNEEASVFIGSIRTYALVESTVNDNNTSYSVTEKEMMVGVQLLVIPHVCRGTDQVILEIIPKQSDDAELTTINAGAGYSVDVPTRRPVKAVHTKMMLHSAETGVIAGLISDTEDVSETSIPGLARLPVLGKVFKHKVKSNSKSNTMILVTPTIIPPDSGTQFDQDIENFKNSLASSLR